MAKKSAPRRPTRKPSMAKAKAMVTKSHKKKAKRNMDTFFLKTKTLFNIVPTQGATVANYVFSFATMDPSGTSAPYTYNAEFNLYRLQYDKFRVNSITYKCKPKANVLDVGSGQNDAGFNLNGDGLIHTCIDRDGIAPSSTAVISRYPSYKAFDVKKPWSRTYAIKYPTGVWLDCQSPSTFSMAKELGLTGGITIYGENFLEDNYEIFNEIWAEVTIEYNIVFQGKTSNNLTGVYDPSGNLTGITIEAVKPADFKTQSVLKNVRGSLGQDTLTTSDTTELPITDKGPA